MKRTARPRIAALLGLTLTFAMASAPAIAQSGKNVEAMLQQILSNQKDMQTEIRSLKEKVSEQDNVINELRAQVQQQRQEVQEQSQKVAEQVQALKDNPPRGDEPSALDILASREQYEVARDLQHHTIFNVRKGEQKEWFTRVVSEFRVVVDEYPQAPEAPQAQIRIARTYRRYLDDNQNAAIEFKKYLEMFPNGPDAKEAQEQLGKM